MVPMNAPRAAAFGAALALLLLPGIAAAESVETPLLSGSVSAGMDGTPNDVRYDTGSNVAPGDDTLYVSQGLRGVDVHWTAAPVDASLHAGLRGFALDHRLQSSAAGPLSGLVVATPDGSLLLWPTMDQDGLDVGYRFPDGRERAAGEHPLLLWPDAWWGLGWGIGYDRVHFPASVTRSSDTTVENQMFTISLVCQNIEQKYGFRPGACDVGADDLAALTPNLLLHSELQSLDVVLDRASVAAAADPLQRLLGELPASPLAGTPGAFEEKVVTLDPLLEMLAAQAGWQPGPGASAGRGSPSTVQSGVAPVPLDATLPVFLAALALLAPAFLALYRRIQPSGVMQHPIREDLVARVRAHPGIHESQLAREMGLRHTHVQYHIRVLEEAGVLEARRFGGLKCLFELGRHSPAEKARALSGHGRAQELLVLVAEQPGLAQRDIARGLGMSESSVKWHLDRLEGSGLVRTERLRGAKRAWPMPGVTEALATPVVPAPGATLPEAPPAGI